MMDISFYIVFFKYSIILNNNILILSLVLCMCWLYCYNGYLNFWKGDLNDKKEWEFVGEITQILIYPIDGGPALWVNTALCTRCGLRSNKFHDRSIIPYLENGNSAVFGLTKTNETDLFDNLGKCMTRFKELRNSAEAPKEIEINYLGDPITILPFNPSQNLLIAMKNFVFQIKLGYFDVTKRKRFMKQIRDRIGRSFKTFLHGFPSSYSTFTLIDEENLEEFQTQILSDLEINFKPQLVVNGKIPFNASEVRIGGAASKIKFVNITPCNLVMPKIDNEFHACLYGFNMEMKNQTVHQFGDVKQGANVHLGDKVFVKCDSEY